MRRQGEAAWTGSFSKARTYSTGKTPDKKTDDLRKETSVEGNLLRGQKAAASTPNFLSQRSF